MLKYRFLSVHLKVLCSLSPVYPCKTSEEGKYYYFHFPDGKLRHCDLLKVTRKTVEEKGIAPRSTIRGLMP